MLLPPVDLPIRFLAHSATLPLRAGVSGVVWAGRAVTWFHDKYSAHQAHKARLGFTRELLDKCPSVLGNFSTNFDPSIQGADRRREVGKVLERIKVLIQAQERDGNLFRKAIKDYEGYRNILVNGKHFRGNIQGVLHNIRREKDTFRHGRRGDGFEAVCALCDDVYSHLGKTYECKIHTTDKLNLFIPTKAPKEGEPVKVLIEAHGVTGYKQFMVNENGLKLKFLSVSGEKLVIKPLTPVTDLDVVETQELHPGGKTLDYTLAAFSGVKSAFWSEYNGKRYKNNAVPVELRRKVRPVIWQTDDKLLEYAKSTNTIVVSPKIVDKNDEPVRVNLSEIYTLLQEKYPNNPLEISCKFCRGITV